MGRKVSWVLCVILFCGHMHNANEGQLEVFFIQCFFFLVTILNLFASLTGVVLKFIGHYHDTGSIYFTHRLY